MFIFNNKSHCCNGLFTDVFTLPLAKNILLEHKLF